MPKKLRSKNDSNIEKSSHVERNFVQAVELGELQLTEEILAAFSSDTLENNLKVLIAAYISLLFIVISIMFLDVILHTAIIGLTLVLWTLFNHKFFKRLCYCVTCLSMLMVNYKLFSMDLEKLFPVNAVALTAFILFFGKIIDITVGVDRGCSIQLKITQILKFILLGMLITNYNILNYGYMLKNPAIFMYLLSYEFLKVFRHVKYDKSVDFYVINGLKHIIEFFSALLITNLYLCQMHTTVGIFSPGITAYLDKH